MNASLVDGFDDDNDDMEGCSQLQETNDIDIVQLKNSNDNGIVQEHDEGDGIMLEPTPFNKYRSEKGYLIVSDLTGQVWCEQRLEYTFTMQDKLKTTTDKMKQGTSIHMARELEVHDVVSVRVSTEEDVWAIKLLNLLDSLRSLRKGNKIREVPLFGEPYSGGLHVLGVIDEIRYSTNKKSLEIIEVKTRAIKLKSSKAESLVPQNVKVKERNEFQAAIYKKLFDDLISRRFTADSWLRFLRNQGLDPNLNLSEEIELSKDSQGHKCKNLTAVIQTLHSFLEETQFPPSTVWIEYVCQENAAVSKRVRVDIDEVEFKQKMLRCYEYWHGDRAPIGVDIEEAWKCMSCEFADECTWRLAKAESLARRNTQHSQCNSSSVHKNAQKITPLETEISKKNTSKNSSASSGFGSSNSMPLPTANKKRSIQPTNTTAKLHKKLKSPIPKLTPAVTNNKRQCLENQHTNTPTSSTNGLTDPAPPESFVAASNDLAVVSTLSELIAGVLDLAPEDDSDGGCSKHSSSRNKANFVQTNIYASSSHDNDILGSLFQDSDTTLDILDVTNSVAKEATLGSILNLTTQSTFEDLIGNISNLNAVELKTNKDVIATSSLLKNQSSTKHTKSTNFQQTRSSSQQSCSTSNCLSPHPEPCKPANPTKKRGHQHPEQSNSTCSARQLSDLIALDTTAEDDSMLCESLIDNDQDKGNQGNNEKCIKDNDSQLFGDSQGLTDYFNLET